MKDYNPINVTPSLGNTNSVQPFRFWCQKVLPLVYDDSLSYYELLCKVVDYLNKVIQDTNTLAGDVTNLHSAFTQLQQFVNDYFGSLDVQEEINNKLDELVNSGRLDLLLQTFVPYVTPMMFGAKGDGVTDDTTAIQNCFNSGKNVIMGKYTYKCTSTIIANHVSIDGYGATLDFSDFTGEHAVYVNSNSTKIRGLTIANANQNTGYALYLLYPANYGIYNDLNILKCLNGLYLSGSWYNSFNNIRISCTENLSDNKCLTIGSAYNNNPANGEQFSNIFLLGGAYGLFFEGSTIINSLEFCGFTCERQTIAAIYGENVRGNVAFNSAYFEYTALSSDSYPIINAPKLLVSMSNLLLRGTYNNTTNFANCTITVYQPIYNASNLTINYPSISGVVPPPQFNQLYPNFGYSYLQSMYNLNLTAVNGVTTITYYLRTYANSVLRIYHVGEKSVDSYDMFFDVIYIYVHRSTSGGLKNLLYSTHVGGTVSDFSSTYQATVVATYNQTKDSIMVTVTLTNSAELYSSYKNTLSVVDITSLKENSIRGVEQ